ncbi:MAG: hypothetical protein Q8O13_00165 [Candidatus Omnitrophota bacterium]|nr:hypothetical protein [Candidatus Omnitrophota bacterium]
MEKIKKVLKSNIIFLGLIIVLFFSNIIYGENCLTMNKLRVPLDRLDRLGEAIQKEEASITVNRSAGIRNLLLDVKDVLINPFVLRAYMMELVKEDKRGLYYLMSPMPNQIDIFDDLKSDLPYTYYHTTQYIDIDRVMQGYRPTYEVLTDYLTVIETDRPYRMFTRYLQQCTCLALKAKRNGKNILILAHIYPPKIKFLDKILEKIIEDFQGITDIQGIVFTDKWSDSESDPNDRATPTVNNVNKKRNLNLKLHIRDSEYGKYSWDVLLTQDGIALINYKQTLYPALRIGYKASGLYAYLWSDIIKANFDPATEPNLMDILGDETFLLRENGPTEKNLPIDSILEHYMQFHKLDITGRDIIGRSI